MQHCKFDDRFSRFDTVHKYEWWTVIDTFEHNNNNDRLTAFDPGQPG